MTAENTIKSNIKHKNSVFGSRNLIKNEGGLDFGNQVKPSYSSYGHFGLGSVGGLTFGFGTSTVAVDDLCVRNFALKRGTEGPQILLSWDLPNNVEDVSDLVIRRRLFQYPKNENDGDLIYSASSVGSPTFFGTTHLADLGVKAGYVYYYRVFSKEFNNTFYVSNAVAKGSILAIDTGYFGGEGETQGKLYSLLPALYREQDLRPDVNGATLKTLNLSTDSVTGEQFNFNETDGKLKGQLERFLKNFGVALDEIKGLIDYIKTDLVDIDKTEGKYIPHLAKILGLDVNQEFDIKKQRSEVRNIIRYYKIKGSITSIDFRTSFITEVPITVIETDDNLLKNNKN